MDDGLAVRTRALRKTYRTPRGTRVAVAGLDLSVPAGGVHGFLGPNGSGKTTSIRMLLGLVRPDSGTMHLYGEPVPERLPHVMRRIGAIVESPKFFPAFSGRKNLSLLAEAIGAPRTRVGEVLELTALHDRGDDRFASYSLGMKQRLAVAATLLKSPDLLIFDEPTNGLDPAGIREIRQTMRDLGREGRTVLVSSHILAEVEQVADTVSIVGQGRLLAEGRVADLIGAQAAGVRATVPDPALAAAVLEAQGLSARADGAHLLVDGVQDASEVTRLLGGHDIWVSELTRTGQDLESVFLELTAEKGLEATGAVR
ncbi:ATP-binding cassette domain-containing protein [Luteipulveratus sp. YIM 133132]|uniref:ATP-binding cassette domain-containing protein n=1 Tax=Luteipulveratus flavus TaxID=3031728 RepID=A0ABT6C5W5_9MICO|nr:MULTISPECIES: ATP-binding cassette domain-containing protein [unclassified Luteipulveratus]MDE9366448.1 ATP-binding cassette domain-containing protein [Luteipulveratus sp. YIM 133132]MDF8264277.1 ATP-binding cassette domain-containing protein [Luteipulveratus sp. YIM 133296]